MMRGNDDSAETCPNAAFPQRLSGALNFGVFVKLIASSRTTTRPFSVNWTVLWRPTSRLYWGGSRQASVLGAFPSVKLGALVNAAGRPPSPSLNQWCSRSVVLPELQGSTPATTLGRWIPPNVPALLLF